MNMLEELIANNPLMLSDEQYAEFQTIPKIATIALVLDGIRSNVGLYMKTLDTIMRESGLLVADMVSLDYMQNESGMDEELERALKLYIYLHNRMAHDLVEGIADER